MKKTIEIPGVGRCELEESENQILIFNRSKENFRFNYNKKTGESFYRSTFGMSKNANSVKDVLIEYCKRINNE